MKMALATLVALALLTSAEPARCQENARPSGERSWYGYQILLADGLAYAALASAITNHDGTALGIAGVGIYMVASPVIHGIHHETTNLLGSIAMRLFIPLAGFAIGEGSGGCSDSEDRGFCKVMHGFAGMGLGMIVATVVDTAMAWTPPAAAQPVPPPAAVPPRPQPMVSLSSVGVVPTANGASLMLAGHF
jgi:hypothetical protein